MRIRNSFTAIIAVVALAALGGCRTTWRNCPFGFGQTYTRYTGDPEHDKRVPGVRSCSPPLSDADAKRFAEAMDGTVVPPKPDCFLPAKVGTGDSADPRACYEESLEIAKERRAAWEQYEHLTVLSALHKAGVSADLTDRKCTYEGGRVYRLSSGSFVGRLEVDRDFRVFSGRWHLAGRPGTEDGQRIDQALGKGTAGPHWAEFVRCFRYGDSGEIAVPKPDDLDDLLRAKVGEPMAAASKTNP
jgi:hypothetical protein